MDAGDADGADALLSLAKLANAESSGILMEEDIDLQQDTYMDQIDTPSIAARPRRSAKPPPKADVRHRLSLHSFSSCCMQPFELLHGAELSCSSMPGDTTPIDSCCSLSLQ